MDNSDKNKRPPIPAALMRRVLVEAGHRCAIPTCRHIDVDVHHIIPWATCHEHKYENLIALCPNCHRRSHKGEIDRKSLLIYKANLRYTHDKFSQFEVDLLFECYSRWSTSKTGVPFASYLLLLVKRLIDSEYVNIQRGSVGVMIGGLDNSPVYICLSAKGKEYVESLGLEWSNNPLL